MKDLELIQSKVVEAILMSTYGSDENIKLQNILDHLSEALILVNELKEVDVNVLL